MIIFKKTADLQQYMTVKATEGRKAGFVPTMGALHAGHGSLIKRSKEENLLTVCSIFVNPTQFNDKKDFEKYPVTIDSDIQMLADLGCDILFLPGVDEIYPGGTDHMPTYDFGYYETVLEGARRPGHFKGVGQVVARLINIVQPQRLYLGQKDYQQCLVINQLVKLMHIEDLQIVICPTMREADGLAMSSRNRRLTEPQRALAGIIYQCLVSIQTKKHDGKFEVVRKECTDLLKAKNIEPEYVALANAESLELLDEYDNSQPMVALVAARVGDVRLIDNLLL